jgi:hypothetical protein
MRIPGWVWLIWAALGLLLEGIAIGTAARGDTLTETTLATFPGILGSLVILGFFGWLGVHFGRRVLKRRAERR